MAAGGVDIATLGLEIDSRGFVRATREADKSLDRLGKTEGKVQKQTKSLQGALNGTMRVLGALGVTVGAGAIIRGLINTNREFQRLQAQLQTVEGSAAGAQAAFGRIEDLAVNTPFQIEGLTEAFVQLRVRGAQPTNEEFIALGDIASAFTRDITEVSSAVASATAGMTRPLRNLGFEASTMGERIQLSFGDAQKTVDRDAQSIITAMMELTSGQVSGAMEREMNTINGVISNLWDNVGKLARAIGAGGGLNDSISGNLAEVRDWIGEIAEARGQIAFFVRVALDGATALISPFKNFTRILFNVGQQVGEVANIIGAVLSGNFREVGAIAERIEGNWQDMGDAVDDNKEAWGDFWDTLQSGDQIMADAMAGQEGVVEGQQDMQEQAELTKAELEGLLSVLDDLSAAEVGTFGRGGSLAIPGGGAGGGRAGSSRSTAFLTGPLDMQVIEEVTAQFEGVNEVGIKTVGWTSDLNDELVNVVGGVAALVDGLGIMDENVRAVVRGVSDAVSGVDALEGATGTLGKVAGGAAVLGAVVGLGRALLDSGKAAEKAQREFDEAMESLEDFGRASSQLEKDMDEVISRAAEAAEKALQAAGFENADFSGLESLDQLEEMVQRFRELAEDMDGSFGTTEAAEGLQEAFDAATEAMERAREEQERREQALLDSIALRKLEAQGMDDQAEALRRQMEQEKELQEAREAGFSESTIEALKAVQAEEDLAIQRQRAAEAAKEAARAEEERIDRLQDIKIEALEILGREGEAERLGIITDRQRRLRGIPQNDQLSRRLVIEMSELRLIQAEMERQIEQVNRTTDERLEAVDEALQEAIEQARADAEDMRELLDAQLRQAKEEHQVSVDQLRETERMVQSSRRVAAQLAEFSDSLLLGSMTTLSPVQQLEEARSQFSALRALAMQGDVSAAASLPDAAQSLLEASREVNASTAGFVGDFEMVRQALDAVEGQFLEEADVQQEMLEELRHQTGQMEDQIAQLEAQRDEIREAAQNEIAELRASAARQQAQIEASAQQQIQEIRAAHQEDIDHYREIIGRLIELIDAQNRTADNLMEGSGPHPKEPDIEPNLSRSPSPSSEQTQVTQRVADRVEESNTELRAAVRALTTGFQATADRLERVETAVDRTREDLRREMEGSQL